MSEFVEWLIKTLLYTAFAVAMIKLFDIRPESMAITMACCAIAKGGAK